MKSQLPQKLKEYFSEKRLLHTLGCLKVGKLLGRIYKEDEKRVYEGIIFHDIARDWEFERIISFLRENEIEVSSDDLNSPGILHGFVASIIARKEFGIEDEEIILAIKYHSTGHPDFGRLGKIVYLADYLDPERKLKGRRKILSIAKRDLNEGVIEVIKEKLKYIIMQREFIHPVNVEFYNRIVNDLKTG